MYESLRSDLVHLFGAKAVIEIEAQSDGTEARYEVVVRKHPELQDAVVVVTPMLQRIADTYRATIRVEYM